VIGQSATIPIVDRHIRRKNDTLASRNFPIEYIHILKFKMDVPPDGGYGWVVVGAIFWNNAHHWGLVSVCFSG